MKESVTVDNRLSWEDFLKSSLKIAWGHAVFGVHFSNPTELRYPFQKFERIDSILFSEIFQKYIYPHRKERHLQYIQESEQKESIIIS